GKRIRTFNLVRELSRAHTVSYLAYGDDASEAAGFLRQNNINTFAVPAPDRRQSGIRFYLKLLANLFSNYPYIVTSHYTAAFQSRLNELVEQEKFDLIICEWTPYAQFIKDITNSFKVIVAHNIESTIWERYERNESNPLKKLYIGIQYRKVLAFERACFAWADGATAVTQQEAKTIKSFGTPYQPTVIDNGVDTEYFAPRQTQINPCSIVFTGSMDWRPNQDAAIFFATEILPLLKKEQPEIQAVFVGRNPPKQIVDLGKIDGITITGTVDDVRDYIASAAVYIVPLRIGGGSRLKILEAMAMQKPVVSTSVGAEGLEVTDRKDILLVDGPEKFAQSVLSCMRDEALSVRIAESGRQLVLDRYRWQQLGKKFSDYLQELGGRS
ncbi:MAG TPA: glycosyltransferase family 4 protein, partial [candidate division Zixibacteria bacterium]|nr:glycosyltransferase family 4 protein [candidate division Zixibacteria bacterium]